MKKYENYFAPKSSAKEYAIPGGNCFLYPDCPTGRLSSAHIIQDGRYPETGFKMNKICTESIFIINGNFEITVGEEKYPLTQYDIFYIPVKVPYSISGTGEALVFIEPKWDSAQNIAC